MVRKPIQMARNKANIDIPNLRGKLALVTGASDGLDWKSRGGLLWPEPR